MNPAALKESKEVVPPRLDDKTPAERRLIFEDSSRAILFARGLQWKTIGATLAILAGVTALFFSIASPARSVSRNAHFLTAFAFLISLTVRHFCRT